MPWAPIQPLGGDGTRPAAGFFGRADRGGRGQKNYDRAISLLREAIEIEDQLSYNEPPDWFFPVRHNLGSVLLKAKKPAEAEKVYREDLKKFPNNGWSLYGLWQSLEAQNKTEEAAKVKQRFEEAWQYGDVELVASRMM